MIYQKPQAKCIHIIIIPSLAFILLTHILLCCSVTEALPVFPGAKGFGVDTPAGRGGTVYKVTNLNDSGIGSLRAAIDASEPRVVIFEVSGTIILADDLQIRNPYITISGQTAPSPGVTLRGAGLSIRTHDVLIQHIRIRVGDGLIGPDPDNRDGIQIQSRNSYNIVVDHVSVSWSIDENISVYNANTHDVTISNCIASEALHDSIHPKNLHSMGILISHAQGVSIINNLIAHNNARNPQLGNGDNTSMAVVNNVIYNWGDIATRIDDSGTNKYASVVGNVYIRGMNSNIDDPIIVECGPNQSVYVDDNKEDGIVPNNAWDLVTVKGVCNPEVPSAPVWPTGLVAEPVNQVNSNVLTNVGARPADRDAVDIRIINDVINGTGSIIDSQDEVGGWPNLAENYRTLILPNNPNDDDNGNGYTNLEEWLHTYAADVEGGTEPFPPDNEAPTIPANLTATVISSSQVDLSWSASTDNFAVTGYIIYRDGVPITTSTTTSYLDTGLLPSTTFAYEVSAIDWAGNESGQSSQVSATTFQSDTTPPAITSVDIDVSPTQVIVVFSEPIEESNATNVSNYSIDNGITVLTAVLGPDQKTVTLTTSEHADGVTYTLTVNNIIDLANTPNVIIPNTTVSYTYVSKIEFMFTPVADTYVQSSAPTSNYGFEFTVKIDGSPTKIAYFRFNVMGISGTVQSAKLELVCINGSSSGGTVRSVSDIIWDEGTINFDTGPLIDGPDLYTVGAVNVGDVVEFDVTPMIAGNGIYSCAIISDNNNGAQYSAREDLANAPILKIIAYGGVGGNNPPQIDGGPTTTPNQIMSNETAELNVQASDIDGDSLTYTWTTLPGEGIVTGAGDTVTYAPPAVNVQQTFTITVTVVDGKGGIVTGTVDVTVVPAAGGGGAEVTFTPVADAYVQSNAPTSNFGFTSTLKVDGSPVKISYLRFDLTGIIGAVQSAYLRLVCINGSPSGGAIHSVSNIIWGEGTVTFNNAPEIDGPALGVIGAVNEGDVVEIDVTPVIAGNGIYSFGIVSNNGDAVKYSSREDLTNSPVLVITTD
jgi:hypothetical protein